MTRKSIIELTVNIINQLPESKAEEISDFAIFLIKQYEETMLTKGLQALNAESKAFDFLKNEDDLYTIADLKKVYNE